MDRKENNIGSDTIVFSIKNSKDSEMKKIISVLEADGIYLRA